MEAANRGAHDVGALSLGLNITLPHEQTGNRFITPSLNFKFHYFALRKMHFMMRAKALVADELPSETEFVATLQTKSFLRSQPVLEASEEQLKRYPLPNKTVTPAGSGVEPAPEYPPLESGRP